MLYVQFIGIVTNTAQQPFILVVYDYFSVQITQKLMCGARVIFTESLPITHHTFVNNNDLQMKSKGPLVHGKDCLVFISGISR